MSVLPLTAREPGRDLLQLPAVAVRVAERGPREVGARVLVEARGPADLHLADVDAAADEIRPGSVNVLDREDHGLSGPRLRRRAALAELDRARRVGRRELHRADVVADDQVDVEPPPEALIEALGPIDVGDGQRHDLERHVHAQCALRPARRFAAYVGAGHVDLHWLLCSAASPALLALAPVDSLVATPGTRASTRASTGAT